MDYTEHKDVIKARKTAQELEADSRDEKRQERIAFYKKDGFWEDSALKTFDKRPRYSFPIAKQKIMKAWGEIVEQDIQVNVKPSDNEASEDTAEVIAGIYRSIEYQSGASDVYGTIAKRLMVCGFDCAMIEHDYSDGDAFKKELFIRPIPDSINRVWFFGNWVSPTAEDADAVTVDHQISKEEFKRKFKEDRECESLDSDSSMNYFFHKRNNPIVSQLIYKKFEESTIYRDADGNTYDEDQIKALQEDGVNTSEYDQGRRRSYKIMSRYYDAKGWLNDEEEMVFDMLPVVAFLPNFDIVEDKPISFGMLTDMMDSQRVHNYAASRWVSDTALSPKPKIWATKDQLLGHESKLKTYNTNNDPVHQYNHVGDQPPPFTLGAGAADPNLMALVEQTRIAVNEASGLFGPAEGKQFARQSAEAIELIQHKGDVGSLEYYKCLSRGVLQLAKVAIRAFKKVYDSKMQRRIIGVDGSYEVVDINNPTLNGIENDLGRGQYDVYCDIGPAFRSKREETVRKIEALGLIDPTIITQNKDILLRNVDAPGMDEAAERARAELMQARAIPESQWTEEEKQQAAIAAQQAAANPPPPDPATLIAQAEIEKAQAQTERVQVQAQADLIKAEQAQQDLNFKQELQRIELLERQNQAMFDRQEQIANTMNKMADTLNKIFQATGADVVVSPDAANAYSETAKDISKASEQI